VAQDEPLLGLATTEELMRELIARFTVPIEFLGMKRALVLAEMLGGMDSAERDYRTAGAWSNDADANMLAAIRAEDSY
jgi:hypothetical protein